MNFSYYLFEFTNNETKLLMNNKNTMTKSLVFLLNRKKYFRIKGLFKFYLYE